MRDPSGPDRAAALADFVGRMRGCRICRDRPAGAPLPHEPVPVFQVSATARIGICGQAPGIRAHDAGRPFLDPSGVRLRTWLGLDEATFYDDSRVAVVPMGFCFPGYDAKGGDLPPRPECRSAWHDRLFALLPQLDLVITIGIHALRYHLPARRKEALTKVVADYGAVMAESRAAGGPLVIPLPHPSWRNNAWLKRHPWFEADLLPILRREVTARL